MRLQAFSSGTLRMGARRAPCALGRNGVAPEADKREGDLRTPLGAYALREVLYRPDRGHAPETRLPVRSLDPDFGWCDDPGHADYNRAVRLPHPASCERLWREDGIYDLIVVLGHNDDPPRPGLGSAIFLHIARPGFPGTEGCVALAEADLRELLRSAAPGDRLEILSGSPDGVPAGT